jgi:hypothetical protein
VVHSRPYCAPAGAAEFAADMVVHLMSGYRAMATRASSSISEKSDIRA